MDKPTIVFLHNRGEVKELRYLAEHPIGVNISLWIGPMDEVIHVHNPHLEHRNMYFEKESEAIDRAISWHESRVEVLTKQLLIKSNNNE